MGVPPEALVEVLVERLRGQADLHTLRVDVLDLLPLRADAADDLYPTRAQLLEQAGDPVDRPIALGGREVLGEEEKRAGQTARHSLSSSPWLGASVTGAS